MPNGSGQSNVGYHNKIKDVRGPLVFDAINIQAHPTHVEGLSVQFLVAIGMVLVVWAECRELGPVNAVDTRKATSKIAVRVRFCWVSDDL